MLARDGVAVPVREERDLFRLAGVPWMEPEARIMDCLEEEGVIGTPDRDYQRPIYADKLGEALSTANDRVERLPTREGGSK